MSGGERQRLGLARALLQGSRVLVLDDATSSLDTATEAQVSAALTAAAAGRTRLVVAHRAMTAARADVVAWLDAGRLRGFAPHGVLWADRSTARRSVTSHETVSSGVAPTEGPGARETHETVSSGVAPTEGPGAPETRETLPGLGVAGRRAARAAPPAGTACRLVGRGGAARARVRRLRRRRPRPRFLAGKPWTGLGWLGVYGAALLVKALATRRMFAPLADVVEPLRDLLVRHVVTGALAHATATDARPDAAGVARLTEQVEPVRGLVSALLRSVRQIGTTIVAAVVGLAFVAPLAVAVVVPPVLVTLVLFARLLGTLGARKRALLLAGEAISRETGRVLAGVRDVVACGAQDRAARVVGAAIDAEAHAARDLARAEARRLLVLAIGTRVPVVALLVATPWLRRHAGLSTGEIVGAVTYVAISLESALGSLVSVIGTWGVQLDATLARLAEAGPPAGADRPAWPAPAGYTLATDALTFGYGPLSEPIVDRLRNTQ
jgi:ABC-type multidrug transport system fused ATPase/permease subunit